LGRNGKVTKLVLDSQIPVRVIFQD
jgi:hypothetical protein